MASDWSYDGDDGKCEMNSVNLSAFDNDSTACIIPIHSVDRYDKL